MADGDLAADLVSEVHDGGSGIDDAARRDGEPRHGHLRAFDRARRDTLWRHLRQRPYVGVALTSALALTLASLVGVGEFAVACLAGYGMSKMLRRNEPPSQAFRDVPPGPSRGG